ncbi:SPOR domain-containing protein [Kaarinaea lacus]
MVLKHKMIGNAKVVPMWMWLFAFIAVSSFVTLLLYLDQYEKGHVSETGGIQIEEIFSRTDVTDKTDDPKSRSETTAQQKQSSEDKNTSFDFYSLLPKMEVLVPENEVKARSKVEPASEDMATKSMPATAAASYFLQAGAFKDLQAADRMKANLAFIGVPSKIESVKLPDSGVWHRVRVGPFNDLRDMNKIRNVMQSNNIQSITVKVKS